MAPGTLQRPLFVVALAPAVLLLIPAAAMQLTSEMSWGPGDFFVAASLLFGAGVVTVLGFTHVRGFGRHAALIGAFSISLAVVWAELAVGLFS